MRFQVLLLLALLALPVTAVAQTDEIFDMDIEEEKDLSTEEYLNVPKGLMIPPPVEEAKPDTPATPAEEADVSIATEDTRTIYDNALTQYRKNQFKDALKGLEHLARNNHAGGMELLGVMYRMGQGVEKNIPRAVEYLTRASDEKRPLALHHLGIMRYSGEGFDAPDPTRALMYLHLAIIYYPDGAEKERAKIDRESINKVLTRRDKENAMEMTREWLMLKNDTHLLDTQTQ